MVSMLFFSLFVQLSICHCSSIGERFVELYNKIVLEIIRHSTAVSCSVSYNPVLIGINFYIWAFLKFAFMECINHDV